MIPTEEQRGTAAFDLERARGLRDFLQDDCAEVGDVWAEMIAEIERLRADYDKLKSSLLVIDGCKKLMNQAARIDELEADNQNLVTLNKSLMNNDWILRDNNRKYRKRAQKAELLNKELKADLEQSERVVEARLDVIDQQAAKIRELEEEIERRAKPNASDDWGNPIVLSVSDGVYDPPVAKGKIGPDARPKCDHAWQAAIEERGYQTCLKCGECRNIEDIPRTAPAWQITEERKAAIDRSMRFLAWSNAKTNDPGTEIDLAVLRAMLTEADHDKP